MSPQSVSFVCVADGGVVIYPSVRIVVYVIVVAYLPCYMVQYHTIDGVGTAPMGRVPATFGNTVVHYFDLSYSALSSQQHCLSFSGQDAAQSC